MAKDKLKPGFDPIWASEFLEIKLKKMSRTAFILRQMYRAYRNPETNICTLSDLQIHNITGWHRRAIRRARKQLIALGEIIPIGYYSFAVKTFHQYQESCAQKAQPQENDLSPKGSTSCAQRAQLQSHSDITDTDIQIERICQNCQNYNQKDKACPILLCALPPYTQATGCPNFKSLESEVPIAKP